MTLFDTYQLGSITLKNRAVMAPMTRSRAIDNIPNSLMATYYAQRAEAGLIISEGIAPSPNGLGYARIPGLYSEAQTAGWKQVTEAVHAKGGRIFAQLMHTGRVSHPLNMPAGAEVVAPSAVKLDGDMYTDQEGMQPYPTPREMTEADIEQAIAEYVTASKNAIAAGFDGVELHGANGYLINQFLSPITNQRTDKWGGNVENRNRFALEVAKATIAAIGADKTGIRISPYGAFNGLHAFDGIDAQYEQLAAELGKLGVVYIHTVDHSSMGAPEVPAQIKEAIAKAFGGTIIASGGLDKDSAEAVLQAGKGHLVAFGRPFLANPDLLTRFTNNLELNQPDFSTFYTPGEKGYTDYPVAENVTA